ncbi:MAG: low molecular weight phosphatase family protein [Candidatus Thermoplasmatota archaeon]|jgi:protein-tyrosine-phosphatase/ribosomal protein S27AE|nr:low molecular weight phosphatase family protein [Candidatus Thermoplasmatota archaeon]MDP7265656.1 low molecular weight phosphatase family protein [Candidatus Thermoplasmatota archaeon]
MVMGCPGTFNVKTPTLKIKKCPECGSDVELFSIDVMIKCAKCGFTVYNDMQNCVQWCKYAKDCVGEELFLKLKKRTVLFICRENSLRSQMAEALALELNTNSKLLFESGGTHPTSEVDQIMVDILHENGIEWVGKPKKVPRMIDSDFVVTFGCDLECLLENDAPDDSLDLIRKQLGMGVEIKDSLPNKESRLIMWDIDDPKGKGMDEYRKTFNIIKTKVMELLDELK